MSKKAGIIIGSVISILVIAIITALFFGVAQQRERKVEISARDEIGIPVGVQRDDLPTLEMFYDYTCYHCTLADSNLGEFIFTNAGEKFNLVLQPVLTVGQPYAQLATEAMIVVSEKEPEVLPEFHSQLMAWSQSQFESDNTTVLTSFPKSFEEIKAIAKQSGVSDEVIQLFPDTPSNYLQKASESWVSREIVRPTAQIGTPEFVLDDVAIIRQGGSPEEDLSNFTENFR